MNIKLTPPRELKGREFERWLEEVSKRISNSDSAESNESLTWLMHEDRNAENVRNMSDIDGLEVKVQMVAFSEQKIRDIESNLKDLEVTVWMGV